MASVRPQVLFLALFLPSAAPGVGRGPRLRPKAPVQARGRRALNQRTDSVNYTKRAPGVYERPSGRLQVAWRARGRLHRELLAPGVTLTEAKRFRKRKVGDAARPQQIKQAPTRCTFATLVDLLAAEQALHRRRKQLNLSQLAAHFAGWKATQIDEAALEAYELERRAAGAADATIRNQVGTLLHALRLVQARRAGLRDGKGTERPRVLLYPATKRRMA